jgi:hypothetical protein
MLLSDPACGRFIPFVQKAPSFQNLVRQDSRTLSGSGLKRGAFEYINF